MINFLGQGFQKMDLGDQQITRPFLQLKFTEAFRMET